LKINQQLFYRIKEYNRKGNHIKRRAFTKVLLPCWKKVTVV